MSDLDNGRGRQGVVSTGRGGAGNLLRSPSRGIDPEVVPGSERGRELSNRDLSGDRAVRSGRGGAGNIRSPSRDPKAREEADAAESSIQERLISEQRGRQADAPFSTGRGGVGNFSRDKSRSRSAVRGNGSGAAGEVVELAKPVDGTPDKHHSHATGRGGWGNVKEERESVDLEKEAASKRYEAGIAARLRADETGKMHSSGKGGFGNITTKTLSPEEFAKLNLEEQETIRKFQAQQALTPHYVAGGRGGAGNYHKGPSVEADAERGRGSNGGSGGGGGIFGKAMRSISRAKGKDSERAKD